ncbi:glycerophosphodiester phosphodiesterase family protein [Sphingomonas sp. MMS24-J13]|uniref:glycerophosphodiester phosphodiesterase family protein n=1 Tax=Sphingomonas sp. MMS24-J13 TaxID=3238686 RepID=UPI003850BA36
MRASFFWVLLLASTAAAQATAARSVPERFARTDPAFIVIAHRGCHNPAPAHRLPSAPENSIAALHNCIALGVDMMETDVRQTLDGALVIIHDETLDRTTTGHGPVAALTLAEIRSLRLRDNMGGAGAAATDAALPTLDEILAAARGRLLLNLDIKAPIYAEVIAAVERAGMADQVLVKTVAGPTTPALASLCPYDRVPFAPILLNPHGAGDLGLIARRQTEQARPIAIELPPMSPDQLPAVVAQAGGVRLWVNTLWRGFIDGWGGDAAALRDPEAVWGRMLRAGITIFQTDEPEALLAFRARSALSSLVTR